MSSEWSLVSDQSSAMSAVGETTALIVDNGSIYCTFTDGNQQAIVARKTVENGTLDYAVIGSNVLNDAHNGSSIGVDQLGFIHAVWNIHGKEEINYKKSIYEGWIHSLVPESIGGTQPHNVSYARFYRAGQEFYLLVRVGYSGNGDEWIKRWTPSGWVDLGIPLISGGSDQYAAVSNPYMGCCVGEANGKLHVVWTHREGYYNYGVYYACYDPSSNLWMKANGEVYNLPIKRGEILNDSLVDTSDGTISNSGLGVAIDSSGHPHVVFSKHVNGGPEVFHSYYANGKWTTRQLTDLHLPRLRACPGGPQDGPPRPCDMELQGPFIVIEKDNQDQVYIYYSRSVGRAGPAWQRPPSILYEMVSRDGDGRDWKTREIKRGVGELTGEIIRESNGKRMFLVQETSSSIGKLWLWQPSKIAIPTPIAKVSTVLPIASSKYLELDDSDLWTCPNWTISSWLTPDHVESTMAIIDKGGALGNREFRLLIWGSPAPMTYDPNRVQILIGGPSTWGYLRYPEVEVLPGMITHLVATWDGDGQYCKVYKNGTLISTVSTANTGPIQPSNGTSKVLIGANRSSVGEPEKFYQGRIGVEFYGMALNEEQVDMLYQFGEV